MGHITDRADKFVRRMFGPPEPPPGEPSPPKISTNQEMLRRLNRRRQELLDSRRKL